MKRLMIEELARGFHCAIPSARRQVSLLRLWILASASTCVCGPIGPRRHTHCHNPSVCIVYVRYCKALQGFRFTWTRSIINYRETALWPSLIVANLHPFFERWARGQEAGGWEWYAWLALSADWLTISLLWVRRFLLAIRRRHKTALNHCHWSVLWFATRDHWRCIQSAEMPAGVVDVIRLFSCCFLVNVFIPAHAGV